MRRIIIGPNNYNAWRGDRGDSSELRRQFADQHLRFISALRLNGEWLRKAGFVAGRKVRVTVRVGTILLAALERIV